MVDSMRGPGGGPFGAPLNSGYLARTSSLYFHLSGATYSELLDTWAALEPTLAERAAKLPASRTKREMFTPFLASANASHLELALFDHLTTFPALIAALSLIRVLPPVPPNLTP